MWGERDRQTDMAKPIHSMANCSPTRSPTNISKLNDSLLTAANEQLQHVDCVENEWKGRLVNDDVRIFSSTYERHKRISRTEPNENRYNRFVARPSNEMSRLKDSSVWASFSEIARDSELRHPSLLSTVVIYR